MIPVVTVVMMDVTMVIPLVVMVMLVVIMVILIVVMGMIVVIVIPVVAILMVVTMVIRFVAIVTVTTEHNVPSVGHENARDRVIGAGQNHVNVQNVHAIVRNHVIVRNCVIVTVQGQGMSQSRVTATDRDPVTAQNVHVTNHVIGRNEIRQMNKINPDLKLTPGRKQMILSLPMPVANRRSRHPRPMAAVDRPVCLIPATISNHASITKNTKNVHASIVLSGTRRARTLCFYCLGIIYSNVKVDLLKVVEKLPSTSDIITLKLFPDRWAAVL